MKKLKAPPVKYILVFILVATAGICIQCYLASHGKVYTRYNNYVIFKQSFAHLIQHTDLYIPYVQEYYDLYKYSPSFALFMGLFYYLPDIVGLLLFDLLNVVVFIAAIKKLGFDNTRLSLLLLFLLLEMGISLNSSQTNMLMAGLITFAFVLLEKDKPFWAAFCIAASVFIKLFGIVALVLWLLYPRKFKFALYTVVWFCILGLLPLLVVPVQSLVQQYRNWSTLLKNDHDASYGISFMGWIHSWFSVNIPKAATVLLGAMVFCLPFIRTALYRSYTFRLQLLASILLWVVVFNHKGESPTYIIAMEGVGIWYFSQAPDKYRQLLLWFCLIFTSFSSTDLITPRWVINHIVEPYALKAVFCSVVWCTLIIGLLRKKQLPGQLRGVS